jgi:polyribonucleotide nucleotidyltransferase
MASICGSTLSLMDAGVPIKRPVAGIAMGLMMLDDDFTILTDIQGMEDALGDMDFKVAGTSEGITALQMDIKIGGVSSEIMAQALEQARQGRMFILEKMTEAISAPRNDLSLYAPRIITLEIPVDKIRDVIGPGGKIIRDIIAKTGVSIDIEDDGRVYIASTDGEGGIKAQKLVESYVKDVQVGEIYPGTVKRIMNFGAFVEILPGKEGLVHISQLEHRRVNKVEDVVDVGDEVMVKVIEIDRQGRINLSRKETLPKEKESEA